MADLQDYKEEINKTGFVLEYKVSKKLEEHGWNVITNRYYIDIVKNIDREIDILAYKVIKKEDTKYYTSLIISCKKSSKQLWAFLTKDLKENDPNINYHTLSNWTNNNIIKFMLNNIDMETEVKDKFLDKDYLKKIYSLDKQLFAFQQMNKTSGKPKNDSDIYNSIITAIKALEYEKSSLSERKKEDVFYNFNLLSVFDGDFIELYFEDDNITPGNIDSIKYLNRHIVGEDDDFYRVHFVKYEEFESYLENFNKLFVWNKNYYSELKNRYYNNVFKEENWADLFWNEFKKRVEFHLDWELLMEEDGKLEGNLDKLQYEYDNNKLVLKLSLKNNSHDLEEKIISKLNNIESDLRKDVEKELKDIYSYDGNFEFKSALPF